MRDTNDAHVAACAYELVTGGYYPAETAVILSTRNLDDFKIDELLQEGISVMHPDAFLMSLPVETVALALRAHRASLASAPGPAEVLARLEKDGNPRIAQALRAGHAQGKFAL